MHDAPDREAKTRRLAWGLAALVGVGLGLGAYTVDYAEGTSYLSDEPSACVNCHVMRDHHDAWQKTSHHAVANCNDCHVPVDFPWRYIVKAEHGWRHSKGFTLGDFHEPIRLHPSSRPVLIENCLRCHGGLFDAGAGHGFTGSAPSDCLRCHADVGHGARR